MATSPIVSGAPKMPMTGSPSGTSAPPVAGSPTSTIASNPYAVGGGGTAAIPGAPVIQSTSGVAAPGVPSGNSTQQDANTNKQLTDIFGKGVGGAEASLLNNLSGVDAASMKDYIASLQPVEASDRATLNSTLGAQGVSANSSVNAIANSNLTSKYTAMEAGESANLLQHNEDLQASILGNAQNAAQKEVASSGWDVFSQVVGAVGDIAKIPTGV